MAESDVLLDQLSDQLAFVNLEKNALQISTICERARTLIKELAQRDKAVVEVIDLIQEMRRLDQTAVSWRRGPEWIFRAIRKVELVGDASIIARFPDVTELHPDAWIAYEWNYHRTSRMLMHEQLLTCLRRVSASNTDDTGEEESLGPDPLIPSLEMESVATIRALADSILATVPQMLGDIAADGSIRSATSNPPKARAIGAYLLLWPIKIIKGFQSSVSDEQRSEAQQVFERIREYTGMKSLLGDLSVV
jgi:hypothetical protein